MPLLDHFHPPLFPRRHWESFHVNWAGAIADSLNEFLLPDGYFAEEHGTYPDEYGIRVFENEGGEAAKAEIAIVSPANKDRIVSRGRFASMCIDLLRENKSLVVVDIVTNQKANLHSEIMGLLGRVTETGPPGSADLYCVAYRTKANRLDLWAYPLAIGSDLPKLPLFLDAELCVPIDLESTYTAACNRRRLS